MRNKIFKGLGTAFVDGVYEENDYKRQKRQLELELESLVVPQADAAEEAGQLIEKLPELWQEATLLERRTLLLTMLDGVYIDAKDEKRVVAIKPKPAFRPVFQVATTKAGSDVVLFQEECPENRISLRPVGMRLTAFRVPGGDGGGSNSPSRKRLRGYTTGLAGIFNLELAAPSSGEQLHALSR